MNKPTSLGTLAERVRLMRDRLRMSRRDLAELSRLSLATIGRIERGQAKDPRGGTLSGLSDAFLCSFTWLVSGLEFVPIPITEGQRRGLVEVGGEDPLCRFREMPTHRLVNWNSHRPPEEMA